MEIRKALPADEPHVIGLWKKLMSYEAGLEGMHETFRLRRGAEGIFRRYLKRCMRSRNCLVMVAKDRGRIVAYSLNTINKNIPIFSEGRLGYMSDLFVEEGYRKRGISSEFRKQAFAWFRKKGLRYASIKAYTANSNAREVYGRWGFEEQHLEMRMKV